MQTCKTFLAAGVLACTVAPSALAATFNFSATFDGTDIALDSGSDTPAGTMLTPGDVFDVTLTAAGADFWRVTGDVNNAFVPLSFRVSPNGTRLADIETAWKLDGAEVATQTETGASQRQVHVGAQLWTLASGLEFDEVMYTWTFVSGDDATIEVSTDIFADFADTLFFRDGPGNGEIEYVEGTSTVIPLPAAFPLLLAGLAGLSLLRRRV